MAFSERQLRALRRSPNSARIRTRMLNGRELSYLEGWHTIAEANRIFGFENWDRETMEAKCVLAREIRGEFCAIYIAKVRITVRADGPAVVREGQGSGEARGKDVGEAHETALKAAETDGTKRALATFGKPFGLGLYITPRSRSSRHAKVAKSLGNFPTAIAPHHGPSPPRPELRTRVAEPDIGAAPPVAERADGPQPELSRIDKSQLAIGAPRRRRDKAHLRYVAEQPCLLCGRLPSDAHHLRFAQTRALGLKVSDEFTVPLCRIHHRQLHHNGDEAAWWKDVDIDAISIANGLWAETRVLKTQQELQEAKQVQGT